MVRVRVSKLLGLNFDPNPGEGSDMTAAAGLTLCLKRVPRNR